MKPKVYFDMNAINFLCDKFKGKSKRPFKKYEILFSWPLFDEIECNVKLARAIDLAVFMWQVSNRKILLNSDDLIFFELQSLLTGNKLKLSDYYDSNDSYLLAWNELRKGTISIQDREKLRANIAENKNHILSLERERRKTYRPEFQIDNSFPKDWNSAYNLLLSINWFNKKIYNDFNNKGILNRFIDPQKILELDYKKLPCASIGLEFFGALKFLIDSQSKKIGSPDRGDLPDMQHAFYIGLADYFVTNDERVYHISHDLIDTKGTKVQKAEEFLKDLLSP